MKIAMDAVYQDERGGEGCFEFECISLVLDPTSKFKYVLHSKEAYQRK